MQTSELKAQIDDSYHVLRYCGESRWATNSYGIPHVKREAFRASRKPFSFNWLEYYDTDEASTLIRICECHTHKNITKKGKFLKLNIGDIRSVGRQKLINFSINHTPNSTNKSHASVAPSDNQSANALFLFAEQHGILLDVPEYRKIPIEKRKNC